MDSLSQIALGAAVADAALGRQLGRRAMLLGGVLGTLPDLDVLIRYDDAIDGFTLHRGFSHSLFVLSLASLPIAYLARRAFGRAGPRIALGRWWLACWAVLITHPLLDAFTSYGTQLFWPIPVPPVAIGSIFIIDPLYTLPLLAGLWIAWRHRPRAQRAHLFGLGLSTLWLLSTLVLQWRAEQRTQDALRAEGLHYEAIRALPFPGGLLWRVLARNDDEVHVGWSGAFDGDAPIRIDSIPTGKGTLGDAAALDAFVRLDWFTDGFVAARVVDGTLVMTDLRIGTLAQPIFAFDTATALADGYRPQLAVARSPTVSAAELGRLVARVGDPDVTLTGTLLGDLPTPGAIVLE